MNAWIILFSLLMTACATSEKDNAKNDNLRRRNLKQYYSSTGLVSYFLPELPHWANYSSIGKCRRDTSIRYVNLEKITRSFAISYEEALEIQLMFNDSLQKAMMQEHIERLNLANEERLFYEVSQKVQQGLKTFKLPKYKRVHVIWFDSLSSVKQLKRQLSRKSMSLGHPILMSVCKSRRALQKYLEENNLANRNIRLISSEFMSPYNVKGELKTELSIDLNKVLPNKKIYFYSRRQWEKPNQIKGNLTKKYF